MKRSPLVFRSHRPHIGDSFSRFRHSRDRTFGGRCKQQGNSADPFAPDSRVSLSLPLQGSENLTYGAVTESSDGEESASELNRKLTNPVSSIWSISNQFNNFELNNGQWNNNWNFQPVMPVSLTKDLEPDHAAGDALLQHRPARDVPRRIRAGHRAGRSGSGGVAVACELGQLGPRSRAYRHLPDCDLGVHWPGQVAAWTHCRGRLPHEGVSSLACFPSNGGPSAGSTAGPTRTR